MRSIPCWQRWLTFIGLLLLGSQIKALAQTSETFWFEQGQPTALVDETLTVLQAAALDGLDPEDYHVSSLRQQINEYRELGAGPGQTERAVRIGEELTASLALFFSDLAQGRVRPEDVHRHYDSSLFETFDAQTYVQDALASGRLGLAVERAAPSFPLYPLLRQWLVRYRALEGHDAWREPLTVPQGRRLDPGQSYPDLPALRRRLIVLGDMTPQVAPTVVTMMPYEGVIAEDPTLYDAQTVEAVRAFQLRHGLTVDGIVGLETLAALNVTPAQRVEQIALSMERVRWTPLQHHDRLLVVNVPGFTLYGYEVHGDDQITMRLEMPVIIGRALNHKTPIFNEMMRYIEFSPYWNIPISIARGETLPAIAKDPNYLSRQQMEFVDSAGNVLTGVSPEYLQAVRRGEMRIRQRPGSHNALGGVKFVFPNNMNIFMHHTPATGLFARSRRDFSHGCIRVENPVALAQFVLEDDPAWDESRIRAAMASGRSTTIRLRTPVPVVIAYSTVMAREGGGIAFYPDIYGHDKRLAQVLAQQRR